MVNQAIKLTAAIVALALTAGAASAHDEDQYENNDGGYGGYGLCAGLPSHHALQAALVAAQGQTNGGFGFEMWGTIVNRDGIVCAVAFTGSNRGAQWPGSRVISAQKANTANDFSLSGFALSTANLYSAVQPGGSLFGLQHSNPVDTKVAYRGPATNFGEQDDPMVGHRIGGINVFGGGLALYNSKGTLIGGIGVSGDTSCADHNISWRTRSTLKLDFVPAGASDKGDDNINYIGHTTPKTLANDFTHPVCTIKGTDGVSAISAALPGVEHVKP
jgi:uncharacterized protein GlcG (DUF336 family)